MRLFSVNKIRYMKRNKGLVLNTTEQMLMPIKNTSRNRTSQHMLSNQRLSNLKWDKLTILMKF